MDALNPIAFRSLHMALARLELGLINSWDIPPIADRLLQEGHYSDVLAQIASTAHATRSDLAPLMQRLVAENGAKWPTTIDCMRLVIRESLESLCSGSLDPESALWPLCKIQINVSSAIQKAGDDGLIPPVRELELACYEYDCIDERSPYLLHRAELDEQARAAARKWLAQDNELRHRE